MSTTEQHDQTPAEGQEPISGFVGEDLAVDSGSSQGRQRRCGMDIHCLALILSDVVSHGIREAVPCF